MSDLTNALPRTSEPLRVAVQRLHWFQRAFVQYASIIGDQIGCEFAVDDTVLTGIFIRWLRAIKTQMPKDHRERKDFYEFAAALMLRELNHTMPLTSRSAPRHVGPDTAASFWPEGYVCTTFCIQLLSAAVEQDYHEHLEIADAFHNLQTWWSYRENVGKNYTTAAGFLQLMLGHQPNWILPDVFSARLHRELAAD